MLNALLEYRKTPADIKFYLIYLIRMIVILFTYVIRSFISVDLISLEKKKIHLKQIICLIKQKHSDLIPFIWG